MKSIYMHILVASLTTALQLSNAEINIASATWQASLDSSVLSLSCDIHYLMSGKLIIVKCQHLTAPRLSVNMELLAITR